MAADEKKRIIIVGGGQSAYRILRDFYSQALRNPELAKRARFEIIESGPELGLGVAWDPKNLRDHHYMNTYSDTPGSIQHEERLADQYTPAQREALNEGHVPRSVHGAYNKLDFEELLEMLAKMGVEVRLSTNTKVQNIEDFGKQYMVEVMTPEGRELEKIADFVVLASGHWQMKSSTNDNPGVFASPWPASAIEDGIDSNQPIAVMGTGLSAVDAIMTLAHKAGTFTRDADGKSHFKPNPGNEKFKVEAFSPHGMLPVMLGNDGNMHEPHLNMQTALKGSYISLDKVFDMVREEFIYMFHGAYKDNPDYQALEKLLQKDKLTIEEASKAFYDAYKEMGALKWTQKFNRLGAQSRKNDTPMPWQAYARTVDTLFERVYPALCAEDIKRFETHVRPIITKLAYGVVERNARDLQALMEAGCLEAHAIGEHSSLHTSKGVNGADIVYKDDQGVEHKEHFNAVVKSYGDNMQGLKHSSPLMKKMFGPRGLLREEVHAYADQELGKREYEQQQSTQEGQAMGRVRAVRDSHSGKTDYYYSTGGIAHDGRTMEVRGRFDDKDGKTHNNLFVIGPTAKSQTPILEGFGPIRRQSRRINEAIVHELMPEIASQPSFYSMFPSMSAMTSLRSVSPENLRALLEKLGGLESDNIELLHPDEVGPEVLKEVKDLLKSLLSDGPPSRE